MNVPTSDGKNNGTFTPSNFISNTSKKDDDGDVFYETAAAQGVSGLFVALAIFISVHQVNKMKHNYEFHESGEN